MAELILTEKEQNDPTYLDWDDEALGRLVKKLALEFKQQYAPEYLAMACHLLVGQASDRHLNEYSINLDGVNDGDRDIGDWMVIVKKVSD